MRLGVLAAAGAGGEGVAAGKGAPQSVGQRVRGAVCENKARVKPRYRLRQPADRGDEHRCAASERFERDQPEPFQRLRGDERAIRRCVGERQVGFRDEPGEADLLREPERPCPFLQRPGKRPAPAKDQHRVWVFRRDGGERFQQCF